METALQEEQLAHLQKLGKLSYKTLKSMLIKEKILNQKL